MRNKISGNRNIKERRMEINITNPCSKFGNNASEFSTPTTNSYVGKVKLILMYKKIAKKTKKIIAKIILFRFCLAISNIIQSSQFYFYYLYNTTFSKKIYFRCKVFLLDTKAILP